MEYRKTFYNREIPSPNGTLIVEGPVSRNQLEELSFHEGLVAFRQPAQQFSALKEIAELPEGRIIITRHKDVIIGYATFLYPDPLERWSTGQMKELLELGAIEVANEYRGCHVGKNILELSMLADEMEDFIIITTEYYWHWDLLSTGLNVWEYRKIMEKMMNAGGLIWMATDDPEICSHPVNCLMTRIGKRVKNETIQKFDSIRFMNRYTY